jgi:hypothetical protein
MSQFVPNNGAKTYVSAAREKTAIVKAVRGVLYEVIAANLASGGTRYLMLFDKATATTIEAGDLPYLPPIKLEAGDTKGYSFRSEDPVTFSNGIKAALSTSDASYAAPGGDEGHFYARYI